MADNAKSLGPSFDFGVPKDEYDLACAVAAAKSRGLRGAVGAFYANDHGASVASSVVDDPASGTARCCAIGALGLCRVDSGAERDLADLLEAAMDEYPAAPRGNDTGEAAPFAAPITGVDLGRAYAHIMDLRPDDA